MTRRIRCHLWLRAVWVFSVTFLTGLDALATDFKQPGFSESVVFSGLTNPTAVRFLPDGRVLVVEKSGLVKTFPDLNTNTASTVVNLRTKVHNYWDRGLLGLAIDPNFPTNNYVYVLYTFDAYIGGTAPLWGDQCPTPPGPTTDGCVVSGHLSRLTAVGSDWTASEQLLIEDWCQQFPSHSIGALNFGADGYLYVSGGEGASFTNQDWGQFGGSSGSPTPKNPCGDPPVPVGGDQTKPTAEGGSLRSQSPRRTAGEPRVLGGAILRVDPATGAAAPGNPFSGSSDANERRIIGYGLRNPFRFTIKPGSNDVWIADVGWSSYEEINRIPDLSTARNFGWPCYEGNSAQYTGLNICPTQAQTVAPVLTYNHANSVVTGDGCLTGSSSVTGLAFYTGGSNYPPSYNGALFFSDYSRKCMWIMFPGGNGDPDPSRTSAFAANMAQGPVDLQIGPDGNLYYVDSNGGNIIRVKYGLAAIATATPTSGDAPLTVNFDGTGSVPAQAGDTLIYAWDLDGDGQYDDSTASQPFYTYNTSGTYTPRLKVTDQRSAFDISDPITISAGNTPPTAFIDTPPGSLKWKVGDTISFSGHATDAQDGTPPPSALSWTILIQHCPSTCHPHTVQTFRGVASGSFTASDHDYPSYLDIQLTATDSQGLTNTATVSIYPQTVNLTFQTVTTGLQLTVGATTQTAPFTRTVIVGSLNAVSAPSPQGSYQFSSWSDGGAQNHNITAPAAPATYTATYTSLLPPPWVDQDVGAVGVAGSASNAGSVFTVKGSGSDIRGSSDQFNFVYQPKSGDVTIVARVASIQNTHPWAKAAVMIRETLAANSKNAMMGLSPSHGLFFQRRVTTGGNTSRTSGANASAPYWVKVKRTGNTFQGFTSPDGVAWTQVGSVTISMASNLYVGLAVTSHNNVVLNTSTFDQVTLTSP